MRWLCLGLAFVAAPTWADLGSCAANFPDGLQSWFSGNGNSGGKIDFGYNAQLLGSPDNRLPAKSISKNNGSSLRTCNTADCALYSPLQAAPVQDAGAFPDTSGYSSDVSVGANASSSLAGNGTNQYRNITLGSQASLTINSSGQSFYIDRLDLGYRATLTLAPGDYWVRNLSMGSESSIAVSGNGQARLLVRDDLFVGFQTRLNSPANNSAGDADKLFLYGYGLISLGSQSTTSGYIYSAKDNGANDSVRLESPSYVFGAVAGRNISLNSNAKVTYIAPGDACSAPLVPVLSWSMNEAVWTGNGAEVLDDSPNALHGTVFRQPTNSDLDPALPIIAGEGTCGYGVFDTSKSQYIQHPHDNRLSMDDNFTLSVWVKPASWPRSGLMTIASKDENYEFHLKPNGRVNWWWQTTGPNATRQFDSTASVPVGQWTHIVLRYAPSDQRIYINGVLAGQRNYSGTPRSNTDPFQIGNDQGFGGRYFNGQVDEVRIFDRPLSDAQIQALMTERKTCPLRLTCFNDSFDRSGPGADWALSRSSGNFTPSLITNRLRLTEAQGNQATLATLQRIFPADGNYLEVEFDYLAYAGSNNALGADGVAVIFSDQSITPQAGSYGGSLGYAQRGTTIRGFAGGWLGMGVDEYGNFSNPSEGRQGGPGLRRDSVAIRGSGSNYTGYRYLAGTQSLNPGVDIGGTTPGPGHRYKLVMDGREAGKVYLRVDRDTGGGFQNLIANFDARADANQAALPANFSLSFTGSTGGSRNIHELDNLQVCSRFGITAPVLIDHIRLEHDGSGLTCSPETVTVKACRDSACTQLYTDAATVTLAGSGWTPNPVTLVNGQASVALRNTSAGNRAIAVSASTPSANNAAQCRNLSAGTDSCDIAFADSGFIFDVPTQISGKPSSNVLISAVKKDDASQACVPAFANVSKAIGFWFDYSNPSTGTLALSLNGTTLGSNAASPTAVNLSFDGNAQAPLSVTYPDAGQLTLNARFTESVSGQPDLLMQGNDSFVVKPFGLYVATDTVSTCTADINCPLYPGNVRAGDPFSLRVTPVAWTGSDSDADLSDNPATPNYQQTGLQLSSAVLAPVGGDAGALAPVSFDHALGGANNHSTTQAEVGVFQITVTPPANGYLGETVPAGISGPVGRFIPADLQLSAAATLTNSCGTFSYQAQRINYQNEPQLGVTAVNRSGIATSNYDRPSFWRLPNPALGVNSIIGGRAGLNTRLSLDGTQSVAVTGADNGDAQRSYTYQGQGLIYAKAAVPTAEDLPVAIEAELDFSAASLTDLDGACYGGATCVGFKQSFAGSELRLGRASVGNAHGSELQPLSLPITLQTWQGAGVFQLESADTCTVLNASHVSLTNYTGNLTSAATSVTVSGPTAGLGAVNLSAPGAGKDGSATVMLDAPDYLNFDWFGTGLVDPQGQATFGIFGGQQPIIYRRETYR
ncbi:DUF6701 domain-containing protein [Atopomonas sediminilitoris]|uniref:DUF6701 domain-containing protein n=1 Tax=Atopomonas sediminilitoris TaxID=2919919 RepID=UPI001F4F0000|nr:DUF6701 domain-containing protein [Atopomonas sediminilitoris]MCJ8168414.1 hypothetical protein [Atopomonas sediminilitoris]